MQAPRSLFRGLQIAWRALDNRLIALAVLLGATAGALLFLLWILALRPSPARQAAATATAVVAQSTPRIVSTAVGGSGPGRADPPVTPVTAVGATPAPIQTLAPTGSTPTTVAIPTIAQPTVAPSPELAAPTATPDVVIAPTPAATPPVADELSRQIEAVMAETAGGGSATFIGRQGRLSARHRSSAVRDAAGLARLPVLIELYRQAAAGQLDLSELRTIRPEDTIGGSSGIRRQIGRDVSYDELARMMIVDDDDAAADLILDRVGIGQINATMGAEGFADTRFERPFVDPFSSARGQHNRSTTDDLAEMLRRVLGRTMFDPVTSERILALLTERGQRSREWLGRGIAEDVPVIHVPSQTGTMRGNAGIVSLSADRSFVLVVILDEVADVVSAEHAIAELARRTYGLVIDAGG